MVTGDNSLGSRQSGPMLQPSGGKRHYWELDSLRGLAALSVVCSHYLNLFRDPQSSYTNAGNLIESIALTPLFGLFAGHEAVMLFFVLSGFVLSLQFIGRKASGAEPATSQASSGSLAGLWSIAPFSGTRQSPSEEHQH